MVIFLAKAVAYVIDYFNVRKAPGADQLSGRLLRELPRKEILWLTSIYNFSLSLRIFLKPGTALKS